ncbi:MAG: hypothetical protein GY717_17515 [Rhodobacteraceae bacterium]|nr:hypothetical protein [Paracoccaceae bacterium]
MDEASETEVRSLKFLRVLVTVLTAVMIVGFIVLIVFLVTRLPGAVSLDLPDQITLPGGASAVAFTRAEDWFAVVTDADQILIYDLESGSLRQTIDIVAP